MARGRAAPPYASGGIPLPCLERPAAVSDPGRAGVNHRTRGCWDSCSPGRPDRTRRSLVPASDHRRDGHSPGRTSYRRRRIPRSRGEGARPNRDRVSLHYRSQRGRRSRRPFAVYRCGSPGPCHQLGRPSAVSSQGVLGIFRRSRLIGRGVISGSAAVCGGRLAPAA